MGNVLGFFFQKEEATAVAITRTLGLYMNDLQSLRQSVSAELVIATRQWRRLMQNVLDEFGISEASWMVLMATRDVGAHALQVEIARRIGIAGPALVRLLNRLSSA